MRPSASSIQKNFIALALICSCQAGFVLFKDMPASSILKSLIVYLFMLSRFHFVLRQPTIFPPIKLHSNLPNHILYRFMLSRFHYVLKHASIFHSIKLHSNLPHLIHYVHAKQVSFRSKTCHCLPSNKTP